MDRICWFSVATEFNADNGERAARISVASAGYSVRVVPHGDGPRLATCIQETMPSAPSSSWPTAMPFCSSRLAVKPVPQRGCPRPMITAANVPKWAPLV